MNKQIEEIAEKFLSEEKISQKNALLMASLGLNKSAGEIAEITYGVNFSQHAYNEERQQQMIEYLGYALFNWQILALSTGLSADEIAKRFAHEWLTKRTGKASIKDLLKHLKPNARMTESSIPTVPTAPTDHTTEAKPEPAPEETAQPAPKATEAAQETLQSDFARQL